MNAHYGKFITLEGGEGAGKSSSVPLMRDYLLSKGVRVCVTREPGGTTLAEDLRKLLLTPRDERILPETELLMLFAGRAQHVEHVIRPALARGEWVICDRFTDATYAYQGAGRGVSVAHIAYLEQWLQGGLRPDFCLLFDLPAQVGLERAQKRGLVDRFEAETLAFFERIRDEYLRRAKLDASRYELIDASLSQIDCSLHVTRAIEAFYERTQHDF